MQKDILKERLAESQENVIVNYFTITELSNFMPINGYCLFIHKENSFHLRYSSFTKKILPQVKCIKKFVIPHTMSSSKLVIPTPLSSKTLWSSSLSQFFGTLPMNSLLFACDEEKRNFRPYLIQRKVWKEEINKEPGSTHRDRDWVFNHDLLSTLVHSTSRWPFLHLLYS